MFFFWLFVLPCIFIVEKYSLNTILTFFIYNGFNQIVDRYHPEKIASNPEALELFKEVASSYSILSDPQKRRQYDSAGFEVLPSHFPTLSFNLESLNKHVFYYLFFFLKLFLIFMFKGLIMFV